MTSMFRFRPSNAVCLAALAAASIAIACASENSGGSAVSEAVSKGEGGSGDEAGTVREAGVVTDAAVDDSTAVNPGCPFSSPPRQGSACAPNGQTCDPLSDGYGWCGPTCSCSNGAWNCVDASSCSCPPDVLPYFWMTEGCYDVGQQCDYQTGCTTCACQALMGASRGSWNCASTCLDAGAPLWCRTEAGICPDE
jgi:hypothetical protein